MKLYGISGLGADKRVFQNLNFNCKFIPIDWIETKENESLEEYAHRLSSVINTDEEFGILGVSFGGLVAVEISKILNPKLIIIISSVETKSELRRIYRIIGQSGILSLIPNQLFAPPRFLAHWLFGTKEKNLLNHILNDTDSKFAKWAIIQLTSWRNNQKLKDKILKINGTHDRLLPPSRKTYNVHLVENGGHFMIIDKAEEINKIIAQRIKSISF